MIKGSLRIRSIILVQTSGALLLLAWHDFRSTKLTDERWTSAAKCVVGVGVQSTNPGRILPACFACLFQSPLGKSNSQSDLILTSCSITENCVSFQTQLFKETYDRQFSNRFWNNSAGLSFRVVFDCLSELCPKPVHFQYISSMCADPIPIAIYTCGIAIQVLPHRNFVAWN